MNFTFCIQFTGEVTSVVVEINMNGLHQTMTGKLRQLSQPRQQRQQTGIEKSQAAIERDILVQWAKNENLDIQINVVFSFISDHKLWRKVSIGANMIYTMKRT